MKDSNGVRGRGEQLSASTIDGSMSQLQARGSEVARLATGHSGLGVLVEADAFSLLEHTNPNEVINRRIVDEAEGLVKILAGRKKQTANAYRDAAKNHQRYLDLGEVHYGDAYSFRFEAQYSSDGMRTYTLSRSDEFRTGEEGFVLVRNRDGSVLVKVKEISGLTPTDNEEQRALFSKAQAFIHFYAEQVGVDPDMLLDHGRDKHALPKVPHSSVTQSLARIALAPFHSTRAKYTEVRNGLKISKLRRRTTAILGITAAMYAHVPFQEPDATFGPMPLPYPAEMAVDLANRPDHKAQGFEAPVGALELSLADGFDTQGAIPYLIDYDTRGVPVASFDTKSGSYERLRNEMRPGLYRVDVESDNTTYSNCVTIRGDFIHHSALLFTQDKRIADNEKVVAKIVEPTLMIVCSYDGKNLPNDATLFIYQGPETGSVRLR